VELYILAIKIGTAKKILVTGASGFIGQHIVAALNAKGYEVHGTYFQKPLDPRLTNFEHCEWYQLNLLSEQEISELMVKVKPSHLIHLAWYTKHSKYWSSLENMNWVAASLYLLRQFVDIGGTRIVMAGTCAEYDWRYGFCNEKLTPKEPSTLYGVCKNSLQMMAHKFANENGLNLAWGRIFFPFGPGEHFKRLIPSVILSLLQGQIAHCTHGEQIRDFMYVEDVADALVTLLDTDFNGAINIGSGEAVSLKKIIYMIADYLKRMDLVELGTLLACSDDPPMIVADNSILKNQMKWSPHYGLESAIEKTLEWWKANPKIWR
jgi:nucleoside-diphosphate-sugar epimerase